jgi:restriction system protein
MESRPFLPSTTPIFIGRETELEWLDNELSQKGAFMRAPVAIVGPPGIGKTALVSAYFEDFFETRKRNFNVAWIQCGHFKSQTEMFDEFVRSSSSGGRERLTVVMDGGDEVKPDDFVGMMGQVMNYKRVGNLIITKRDESLIRKARILTLGPLDTTHAEKLFKFDLKLPHEEQERLLGVAKGHPLTLTLLARLADKLKPSELHRLLDGQIYGASEFPTVSKTDLITVVQPTIVSASEAMIAALKKQPQDVMNLGSRQFEELIAELLTDMGWDVELTPATRDGGKDILAYLKTDVGRFLCLVEAKRYRSDRTIGVELVRTLYGTLCDYQASSAMMVTTSTFSKDARSLQKKHEFQLTLHDYTDVVGWIMKHGRKRGPTIH